MEDFFFALEIEIDGPVGDVCRARDVGNFGIEIAVAREDAGGGAQNQFALAGRSVAGGLSGHFGKLNESSLSYVSVAVARISGKSNAVASLLVKFERNTIRAVLREAFA